MRLIDRMRSEMTDVPENLPVIIADEVWKAIDDGPDKAEWDASEFPNCAPPFPMFFIEARSMYPDRLPVNFRIKEFIVGLSFITILPDGPKPLRFKKLPTVEGAYWTISFAGYQSINREVMQCNTIGWLHVAQDGTLLSDPRNILCMPEAMSSDAVRTMHVQSMLNALPFCLQTIALMHCKNVEVVEHIPPTKLSRKHEKKHGVPLSKTYTLTIRPTRKQYSESGSGGYTSLKAMHIRRGHFRDYTEGPGLFGKYHGVYWVESHVAGHREQGAIEKRYKVKPE